MKHYTMLGCRIEVDEKRTQRWYANAEDWGCECENCRNFLAVARLGKLPGVVSEQLSRLGIPPAKATYVCLLNGSVEKPLYQFSYRIAGRIPENNAPAVIGSARFCHEEFTEEPDFREPHFDLEFLLELPWILNNTAQTDTRNQTDSD